MAEDLTDPQVRNRNARARAFKARAAQALQSEQANTPTLKDDLLGRVAQGSRQIVHGATGLLDLPAAAITGLGNIPATFYNASQPYGPRKPTPTPQEFFGKPGEPAMQPTDVIDKIMPTIPGHENDVLNLPLDVAGALLAGGGFRGPAAAATPGGVIPTLAVAPAATPGFLPALGRGAQAFAGTLARAGVRTGVTTGAMLAGKEGGGAAGRYIAETLGGPQYGDLGEHYGEQAGQLIVPAAVDVARVPTYNVLNSMYTKPGDVTVPGSSAHTQQAFDDLGIPLDLGTGGNAAASNLLDFTAGLPGSGGPAMRTRADLYGNLEQGLIDATANRRLLAAGGVGPPVPGTGRNIDEVNIGSRAVDAGMAARGRIYDANEANYANLHRVDPATGQPLLARGGPIAVQTEHQAYHDILANPETAQARAAPQVNRLTGELTDSSNLVVDQAVEARIDADVSALRAQQASYAPGSPGHTAIEQSIAALEASRSANRGPSFQAQRDLRALGRTRDGVIVLDDRINDASAAAKTATMRAAADRVGLGNVFDTTEAEASRLLGQRGAISDLLPAESGPKQGVRPTGQEGFNALFNKGGAGDLEQLAALMEHAPAETGLTFADRMELAGRGKASAGTANVNPSAYHPEAIVNLWDNASPQARDVYAPPGTPLRTHIEAVVTAARADTLRTAARTKPGRGSNTLGGPQRFFQNPLALAGIGAGAGSLFGFPALGALLPLIPSAMARLVGNRFTDPTFTRNVIHPPSLRGSLDLSRLLAAAVGGNSDAPPPDTGSLLDEAGKAAGRAARYPF